MKPLLFFIIFGSLVIRVFVSLVLLNDNVILPPSDSTDFHNLAYELSNNFHFDNFYIGWIYSYWLSFFYSIFSNSRIVGFLLSWIVWLISAIYFKKVCSLLGFSNKQVTIYLFLYCFLPSSLFYASDTMREAYQMLFLIFVVYFGINYLRFGKVLYFFKLFFSLFILCLLHHVFIGFSILILAYLLLKKFTIKKSVFVFVIFSILFTFFGSLFKGYIPSSLSLTESVERFNEIGRSLEANSTYPTLFGTSNPVIGFFTNFLQYLLEPFPWRIKNFFDVVVFVENSLRFIFLFYIIKYVFIKKTRSKFNVDLRFLLFCFFVMEGLWSLGTSNWGTAIRHHLPAVGVLLFLIGKLKSIKT
jgi:hypothetical protein